MPLYPVKNLKTGEQKEIHMLVEDYEKWREENPDWDKDWSKGCAGLEQRIQVIMALMQYQVKKPMRIRVVV